MAERSRVTVCDHPLVQEKLSLLRDKTTKPLVFRATMAEVGALLSYEAFKGLKVKRTTVRTPMGNASGVKAEQPVVVASILRAGLGLQDGVLQLYPTARVGHIGLYRNEETLNPVRYYVRLPPDLNKSFVVLCDPMLATGGSAVEAIRILKTDGAKDIVFMCLIASKYGVRVLRKAHPDVPIITAGIDARLNKVGYIIPGLGDAGDRTFAT